mgnify:CR=1 FL=1
MDHAGELHLQRAGLALQGVDGRTVNFGREFEVAARRRPAGDDEQHRCDHEIDDAQDRSRRYRAPNLHQREIC